MSSSYGENLEVTLFGESHGPAVGMTLQGIPAGEAVDTEELCRFLARRSGAPELSTARREEDVPEFMSGLRDGVTCGTPLTVVLRNRDVRSGDYEELKNRPRPGHADYTAAVKYRGFQDPAGGGHASGRLTAALCAAGGICLQLLRKEGIRVLSRIVSVGTVSDRGELTEEAAARPFPTADEERGSAMREEILRAKEAGDSVGGVIECEIRGLPAGVGDPIFGGLENRIARAVFGIPGIKGIEFGSGFAGSTLRGSENNDSFRMEDGQVVTAANHAGGILGGISTGMPVVFRAAVKPTPSISAEQETVDLSAGENVTIRIRGRHDPCIVPRAVPCVEAAAALAVFDALLGRRKETVR